MTFSIQAAGKIPDAIEQVKAHNFGGGDNTQAEKVREFLLDELNKWNENDTKYGVVIEASGHGDAYVRNLNIVMRPLYLQG